MDIVPQLIVNGLLLGGVYAVCALSLAIVYKATQVFNFTVGEMMVVGMFVAWSSMKIGIPVWGSILIAVIATSILGLVIERVVMRPLIGQPLIAAILATFALIFILQGLTLIVWEGVMSRFPATLPGEHVRIGSIMMSHELLWIFVITMLTAVFVFIFFQRTKTGLGMRATAENQKLAQVRGIPVCWIFRVTWMLAAVICGITGVFVAYRLGVSSEISAVGLAAFPAVLLGGLESIPGALIGGLIIGVAISLTSGLLNPAAASIAPFVILLLVVLCKPEGLFGLERIERI